MAPITRRQSSKNFEEISCNQKQENVKESSATAAPATTTSSSASQTTNSSSASQTTNSSPSKRKYKPFKSLYKPRTSPLDFETLQREKNPFRGFFILFWVSVAFRTFVISYQHWKVFGSPISLDFAYLMGKDGWELLVADGSMIVSLFTIVLFQWFINRGLVPLTIARPLQHVWQAAWFWTFISWAYQKPNWAWTQSATFTLHTIAMLMKQHSYTSYNIQLQQKFRRWNDLQDQEKKGDVSLDEEEKAEMNDLYAELTRGGKMFPQNQTIWNFFDYLLVPSLVYELEFPRTERFRLWYFCERVFSTISIMGVLYFIVEHQCNPVFEKMPTQTFFDSLAELLLPFMTIWILAFFLIFECICNAFAEITCFADREFYADWWNSTNYEEFARLWNKPVHHFLLRHLYKESMENLNFSKKDATFLTFLVSSMMHELVFAVVGRKIRFYMFFLQMLQLPLIVMAQSDWFKSRPVAGNIFFWFGLHLGPPLLAVCYCRDMYV